MKNKQFMLNLIKNVFVFTKTKIIEQAQKELAGSEKKSNVDEAVVSFINDKVETSNPVADTLKNVLIECIPVVTQCIYEFLKNYVDGLTEARG